MLFKTAREFNCMHFMSNAYLGKYHGGLAMSVPLREGDRKREKREGYFFMFLFIV